MSIKALYQGLYCWLHDQVLRGIRGGGRPALTFTFLPEEVRQWEMRVDSEGNSYETGVSRRSSHIPETRPCNMIADDEDNDHDGVDGPLGED